ncbi:MAG: hypothetical protein ACE5KE_08780 [Methanosarcinales archaeon]
MDCNARNSKYKLFPAQNKWFTFVFPENITPIDVASLLEKSQYHLLKVAELEERALVNLKDVMDG